MKLNPQIDIKSSNAAYAKKGLVSLDDAVDAKTIDAIYRTAESWEKWLLLTIIDRKHREFDAYEMQRIDTTKRKQFEQLVWREANRGFGYLFENIPIFDLGCNEKLDDPNLRTIFDFVRSEGFVSLGRQITGDDRITFADCQLTRYRAGHFLTMHNDDVSGKNRSAAFVLSLTKNWKLDFGGLLNVLDSAGDLSQTLKPSYNQLNIFKVPQDHAVSAVAPFVTEARYAITGWFRRGDI